MDEDKKRGVKVGLFAVFAILAIILIFYSKHCGDSTCFNTYLGKCSKAVYTSDVADATWRYEIMGTREGKCLVNVKLLVAKEGNADLRGLENNEMNCYAELGDIKDPKSDLRNCNGLLKEKVQEVIIQKMHAYILENIGKISTELQKVI
jgi:hypothetical protein